MNAGHDVAMDAQLTKPLHRFADIGVRVDTERLMLQHLERAAIHLADVSLSLGFARLKRPLVGQLLLGLRDMLEDRQIFLSNLPAAPSGVSVRSMVLRWRRNS
jgi:hypothetical protein